VLSDYLRESIYSYSQLAKRSGVPQRTIVNWLDGTVRRPRKWQALARLAHALALSAGQTDALLQAAGLPPLGELRAQSTDAADLALLVHWPLHAPEPLAVRADPEHAVLQSYCRQVLAVNLALNDEFPPNTAFTFEEIFQDRDLRPLHGAPASANGLAQVGNGDTVRWSALCDHIHRAVILGHPGSGKRWLLRYEAARLARAALLAADTPNWRTARIPFLVTLADLAAHLTVPVMADQVLRAIALRCATQTMGRPEPAVVAALMHVLVEQPARAAFLIDGNHGMAAHPDLRGPARRALELLAHSRGGTVLVTMRPLGYAGPPFVLEHSAQEVELELLPLRELPIAHIVRGWFHTGSQRCEAFMAALRRSPALARQASNPSLLQLYCRLIDGLATDELPDSRELQNRALALMLQGGEAAPRAAGPGPARWQVKLRLLERLAWQLATYHGRWHWHLAGDALETLLDALPEAQLLYTTYPTARNGHHLGLLWELSEQDGLLIKGEVARDGLLSAIPYALLHRTLHTHLVAQYLIARYTEAGVAAPEFAALGAVGFAHPDWREVVGLLVDYAAGPQAQVSSLHQWLCERLCDVTGYGSGDGSGDTPAEEPPPASKPEHAIWLAALAFAPSASASKRAIYLDRLRVQLVATLRAAQLPTAVRVAAGRLLNQVGDPRVEVMDVDALPFVTIPAGTYLQGSDPACDPRARPDELPAHVRWLPGYRISRYPVSQAQFAQFLADTPDPYTVADYWPEAVAAGHWQPGAVFRPTRWFGATGIARSVDGWQHAPEDLGWPYHLPNHPVCGIGWYEARAFARWLERRWWAAGRLRSDERLDLPDEAEWEKAARGPHGWIFPWGDQLDPSRLAWEGLLLMAAPPIGAFPHGASFYGVEEMSGHLWEWTNTLYRPYPLMEAGPPARLLATDRLVLRGGSHFKAADDCRATARWHRAPAQRVHATIRLVIRPPA
jgi:formylglycine-generating enzyme required for sulfatase activity